jgi:hypothetical protein
MRTVGHGVGLCMIPSGKSADDARSEEAMRGLMINASIKASSTPAAINIQPRAEAETPRQTTPSLTRT